MSKTQGRQVRFRVRYIVGVDIGGTFTDFVASDLKGSRFFTEKVLTTPDRPADAVLEGLERLAEIHGVELGQVDKILHATTLATNALIERKGSTTGLLTTSGFEDVLDIRKGLRYNQYDLKLQVPDPYVPRFLRRGISERVLASGEVLKEVDEVEVTDKVRELLSEERKISSLAITFLHSYANPKNEIRAREIVRKNFPDLSVSASHEVTSQAREYERTSTTVVDAYIKPIIKEYIDDLSSRLSELGFKGKLLIMTCSGGVVETEVAKNVPVLLLESGPVAGVSVVAKIAKELRIRGAFSFDMGGTTAKGCVLKEWQVEKSYEFEAARFDKFRRGSGIPISIPVVRLIEIGSGGGSIARVDKLGIVRVGPESAGAKPGPACYDLGGSEPTVTDSDLVLGYLDENYFLGGAMKLNVELARKSIEEKICKNTDLGLEEGAWAIYERVNEDVASAFRLYASEIGVDYRKYSFVPFGGAGPIHAARIARKLSATKVVVPLRAGVLSAQGLIVTPLSIDLAQTKRAELPDIDYESYRSTFDSLIEKGRSVLKSAGVRDSEIAAIRKLDMCYHGQGYEIPVSLPGEVPTHKEFELLFKTFENYYRQKYSLSGFSPYADIVSFKVTVMSAHDNVSNRKSSPEEFREKLSSLHKTVGRGTRTAFDPTSHKFRKFEKVYRYSLKKGDTLKGPTLVQEIESAAVVPAGANAKIDSHYNLVIELQEEREE
ncbi:MAG TPA: hydantoinase/oxoprolinase family protein [Nitrososphaerales archaeon]|nr:hydantoinase/oxoprolinase family protein [Nitrososphaerales archaeon]